MYWLKQCTKCGGDLASNSDQYGPYISCMQCGVYQDIEVDKAQSPISSLDPDRLLAAAVLHGDVYTGNTGYSLSDRNLVAVPA